MGMFRSNVKLESNINFEDNVDQEEECRTSHGNVESEKYRESVQDTMNHLQLTVSRTTTRFYRSLWDVCSRRKRAEKDEVDDGVMWLNTTCKVGPHAAKQTTYISLLNGAHEL